MKLDEAKRLRRNEYQKGLMRERRARLAKALTLAELTGGKLSASAKRERIKSLQSTWSALRTTFIAESGAKTVGEIRSANRQFWTALDARLDENLRNARGETC